MVNGETITPSDREYLSQLQFVWCFGETKSADILKMCPNVVQAFDRPGILITGNYRVSGWLGTVERPEQLKVDGEVLNKLVVFVGGKVAHEDLLYNVSDARVYTKYLVGELQADFLDEFGRDDIATSNRQGIIEDDERFSALLEFVKSELKFVREVWTEERGNLGVRDALTNPAMNEWFEGLNPDEKKMAKRLIGKINQVGIPDADRKQYYKYSVLAFESLKVKNNLQRIDEMTGEDLQLVADVFAQIDDIEATHFYEITRRRLEVVEQLEDMVSQDVKERVLQLHIAKHLWLVDPSWDYMSEAALVEKDMHAVIDELKRTSTSEEEEGRVDIKYSKTYGRHVLIELKKFGVRAKYSDLSKQVLKYKRSVKARLKELQRLDEPLEIVILLGHEPTDTDSLEEANSSLEGFGARIVLYKRLIDDAQKAYREYLDRSKDKARILNIVRQLEDAPDEQ